MDELRVFNQLADEIEKDINAIGCIYRTVGEAFFPEAKRRLAERIAHKLTAGEYKTTKILELISKTTLGNNLCPDHRDKIRGMPCLMCKIEELKDGRS